MPRRENRRCVCKTSSFQSLLWRNESFSVSLLGLVQHSCGIAVYLLFRLRPLRTVRSKRIDRVSKTPLSSLLAQQRSSFSSLACDNLPVASHFRSHRNTIGLCLRLLFSNNGVKKIYGTRSLDRLHIMTQVMTVVVNTYIEPGVSDSDTLAPEEPIE